MDKALLMFALDHIQNIIQVYLAKGNELVVLFNNGKELQKMEVNCGDICNYIFFFVF